MRRLLTSLFLVSSLATLSPSAHAAGIFEKLFGPQRQPANAGGVATVSPIPRETVRYAGPEKPGTIIVNSPERRLYLVLDDGTALRYGVGVGRPGFEWGGIHRVTRKEEWPGWTPPAQMRKRRPDLPAYMSGGIQNPLGARAMYLGSTLYRIHGSNEPQTIGQAVSSGCIRMSNDDVTDLYDRVKVGTKVVIIRG
jgi:lipoprotein-anchoring transpeptidase ErfK/SrfK